LRNGRASGRAGGRADHPPTSLLLSLPVSLLYTDLHNLGEAERVRPEGVQPAAARRRGGAGSLAE